jgi:endonuclease YncB( thermonuclease family)
MVIASSGASAQGDFGPSGPPAAPFSPASVLTVSRAAAYRAGRPDAAGLAAVAAHTGPGRAGARTGPPPGGTPSAGARTPETGCPGAPSAVAARAGPGRAVGRAVGAVVAIGLVVAGATGEAAAQKAGKPKPAGPPPVVACPDPAEPVTVAEVPAGDRFRLADGREVALAGAEVPRRLGRDATFADAPREDAARRALADALAAGPVRVALLGGADRRGRLPGRISAGTTDVTAALLAAGHLRVRPSAAANPCLGGLRTAEAAARRGGVGLWATEEFRLRAADDTDLPSRADTYAVVEGRVVSTGRAGTRRYIDFGRNHRTDFTVVIDARRAAAFAAAGFDLDRLAGRAVRVRGWLVAHDGAEMALEAPEEMEWVEEATTGR